MICNFCSKVKDQIHKWVNWELQEEYKICEVCLNKLKGGKYE